MARDISTQFEWYADWAADVSSLYERLARGVADDDALLDIAAEASEGQPAPQLLLAAVHALLLGGREHPLAEFYPTRTEEPADGDPFPEFRAFCLDNEADLRETVASRRVQTNDVGRSAVLLPSFGRVAGTAADPLALVEVGASAGLNLLWDRYRYEYGEQGVDGDPDSSVCIESTVRGGADPPFPERLPAVAHRVGIDVNPLDVTDSDDARWLRALVVPDQRARHERLAAAIEVASDDPPPLVEGDALDVLPDVLEGLPDDTGLCVFSTHTLYQFSAEERDELRSLLTEFSRDRPIHWLSDDPSADRERPTCRYVHLSEGHAEETQLAEYQSYGVWIRWLAGR